MRTALTELFGIDVPLVGFSRSPAVVAEVSKAGGLGVLAATAYGPEELDVQLTWIEEQVRGRPYGVDVLVPASTVGDRRELVARLRAQIPAEHIEFVRSLLEKYGVEPGIWPGDMVQLTTRWWGLRLRGWRPSWMWRSPTILR